MAVTLQSVQHDNQRALQQAVANLSAVVKAGVDSTNLSLPQVGVELTSLMKQTLTTPGRGRLYRGRRGRGDHVASAPGDPPAPDTGQYRNSWAWKAGPGYVEVGTPLQHGPMLEFGTSDMAPRPHARPTVETYKGNLTKRISEAHTSAQRAKIGGLRPPA